MPVLGPNGEIGYFEWESKIDYEWLGISRERNTNMSDNQSVSREECEAIMSMGPSLEVERLARAHIALLESNATMTQELFVLRTDLRARLTDAENIANPKTRDKIRFISAENANLKRDKERLYWLLAELNEMYSDSAVDVMGWPHEGPITIEDIDAALQGKSAALDSGEEQ